MQLQEHQQVRGESASKLASQVTRHKLLFYRKFANRGTKSLIGGGDRLYPLRAERRTGNPVITPLAGALPHDLIFVQLTLRGEHLYLCQVQRAYWALPPRQLIWYYD